MHVSTVIMGASCYSAGRVLGSPEADVLVIDRTASVGGEYFNSYRYCSGWQSDCSSETTRKLQREMQEKGAFDRPYADFFALAPMLYRELMPLSGHFMLTTEIATITPCGSGFKLEVYNQSGRTEIVCDHLLDTVLAGKGRPLIASKRLNAAVIIDPATKPVFSNFKTWQGRGDNELFLSLEFDPATDWPTARREFISRFESETQRAGALITSLAKEFDYEVADNGRQETIRFINPLCGNNPLAAIEAGIKQSSAGV